MKNNLRNVVAAVGLTALLAGCGSAYSGLTEQSGLGAGQYIPAVYVEPGHEQRYQQVLQLCRQVAMNRQMTAAQEAQFRTLTGAVEGAGTGAAAGLEFGNILNSAGFDTDALESAGIGAAAGIVGSLASAFASGAEETAEETKRILLACLRRASKGGWDVLE